MKPKRRASVFWSKVDRSGDCWLWTGIVQASGYGKYNQIGAHRVAYELMVGPIPDGLQLDHLCRVPRCVNPAHLEPVTGLENMRRRYATVTHCKHGHEFDEVNTYFKPNGHRGCRACIRNRTAKYKNRKNLETAVVRP